MTREEVLNMLNNMSDELFNANLSDKLEYTDLNTLAESLKLIPKVVKLCKEGSIIEQLKKQLPDSEIIDLLDNFGLDQLLEGGLKKGSHVAIEIVIESTKQSKDLKTISIGDKLYEVEVVTSEEDMEKGLSNRDSLEEGKGMLFDFKEVQESVTFNMEDCSIPLDIIFINDDDEVIRVVKGCPNSLDLYTEVNVRYVLEVNKDSGIKKGDEFDLSPDEETPTMKVLAPDGSTLMELQGGERIFSRIKTRLLIKWAKRADKSKKDSDYKRLGSIMFKEIDAQDERPAEYVLLPEE